jgi:hypothetical protein
MTLDQLIPVLQMAIGPTILISGVGMLLLVMTNRLGRTIDRARHVVAILRQGNELSFAETRLNSTFCGSGRGRCELPSR